MHYKGFLHQNYPYYRGQMALRVVYREPETAYNSQYEKGVALRVRENEKKGGAEMISRYFDQDKVMMLNAAYDTLESMNVRVLHVNSEAGSIIFRMDQSEPIRMLICTLYPGRGTRISMEKIVETEEMNAQETEQMEVFLDELESGLRKIQAFDVHTGK